MIQNKMYLAQIGNFPFCKINLKENWQIGVKTQLEDTPYTDGKIRTNQMNRNFKQDAELNLECWVDKDTDLDSFIKLNYNENEKGFQKLFFVKKKNKKTWTGNVNIEQYEIYFNWGEIISSFSYSYTSELDEGGAEYDVYQITVRMINPYFYRIKNRLRFLAKKDLPQIKNYTWGQYLTTWGGTGIWGQGNSVSSDWFLMNSSQQKNLIEDGKGDCCIQGLFLYTDIYFKFEAFGIESILPSNQARDRYSEIILTGTLGTNTDYSQDTILPKLAGITDLWSGNGMNLITTATNSVNIIEITNYNTVVTSLNTSALQNGDRIEIYNPATQSGFAIAWLSSLVVCPPKLTIYSHIQDGVMDGNGNWLNNYSGTYARTYKLELLSQSKINDYLITFRGLYPLNSFIDFETTDQLLIKRNFSSIASRTTRILISNLETFH